MQRPARSRSCNLSIPNEAKRASAPLWIALASLAWPACRRAELPDVVPPYDVIDTVTPREDAPPVNGGFRLLTATLPDAALFPELDLDAGTNDPSRTAAILFDEDQDGRSEVLLQAVALYGVPFNSASSYIYAWDQATQALRWKATIPYAQVALGCVDLDDDGRVEFLLPNGYICWSPSQFENCQMETLAPTDPELFLRAYGTIHVDDLDLDGWLDLVVQDARCCASCRSPVPYLRVEKHRFQAMPELMAAGTPNRGWGVFGGELAPGLHALVALSQPCSGYPPSSPFYRAQMSDSIAYPTYETFDPTPPGVSFRRGDQGVQEISERVPMSLAQGDVDGDGRLDLTVTLDPYTLALRSETDNTWTEWDEPSWTYVPSSEPDRAAIPWGIAWLDIDRDGRVDLLRVHGNDAGRRTPGPQFLGPQPITVHRNGLGRVFTDISHALGLRETGQFRNLSLGDLDGDGAPDFAVGAASRAPLVYHNELQNGLGSVALKLHGTVSNPLGLGARVHVRTIDGQEQWYLMGDSSSPDVYTEPMLFPTTGAGANVALLEILWPSGYLQRLHDVSAGSLHRITEPPFFTVEPSTRHLPADGTSSFTIRIAPVGPEGQPDPTASLQLRLAEGSVGTLSAPVPQPDGSFLASLRAPNSPGVAVLVLQLRDTPVLIRPRVFWD